MRPRATARGSRRTAAIQERVTRLSALVERFVYDLGLVTAGCDPDIDGYVAADLAERLRSSMRAARAADVVTRPDFGDYAQMTVDGDIVDATAPARVTVDLDDRSTRVDAGGNVVVRMRRRVHLHLVVDAALQRIVDCRVEIAS